MDYYISDLHFGHEILMKKDTVTHLWFLNQCENQTMPRQNPYMRLAKGSLMRIIMILLIKHLKCYLVMAMKTMSMLECHHLNLGKFMRRLMAEVIFS